MELGVLQTPNIHAKQMTSRSSLMGMPTEIRLLILEKIMDAPEYVVATDGKMTNVPGVIGTCRALYHDSLYLLYLSSRLSFSSAAALQTFHALRQRTCRKATGHPLSVVRRVRLDCGAAKHAPAAVRNATRHALRLLAKQAGRLETLDLRVAYFYRASSCEIPISSQLIKSIAEFRGLSQLTLIMSAPPPGPIDYNNTSGAMLAKMNTRIAALTSTLSQYACTGRPNGTGVTPQPCTAAVRLEPSLQDLTRLGWSSSGGGGPRSTNLVTQVKVETIELLYKAAATR